MHVHKLEKYLKCHNIVNRIELVVFYAVHMCVFQYQLPKI